MSDNRRFRDWNRWTLRALALLFVLFWLNLLLGKAKISFGWQVPYLLGDVPEFLLLLLTALVFTLAALSREALVGRHPKGPPRENV